MREATEEAFGVYRHPEAFVRRLAGALPPSFSIDDCRSSTVRIPGEITYRTYLVDLTQEVPPEIFTLNRHECDACRWFSAGNLPPDAHWGVWWTVRRLGLA